MATTLDISLDNAVGHIAKGVGTALEAQIREALMPHAEKVVDEVAKQLCKNLKTTVTHYRDCMDGSVTISLVIDGERHEF